LISAAAATLGGLEMAGQDHRACGFLLIVLDSTGV